MLKNFASKVKSKAQSITGGIRKKVVKTVCDVKAEGYVDTGVKVLIAVVVGALVLASIYTLFKTNIFPTVTSKISGLFSYNGTT